MKKLIPILLSALMLTGCAGAGNQPNSYRQISMDEAVAMMEQESGYIILDVRTPEEFAAYAETIVKTDYEGLRETADKCGWLLFQAHPYRPRTKRLSDKYLDGIEIFNANPRHCNYNFVAALKAASRRCPVVAGSDFHKPKDIGSAMLFPRKPANEKDLAEMLKKREYKILKEKSSWDKDSD